VRSAGSASDLEHSRGYGGVQMTQGEGVRIPSWETPVFPSCDAMSRFI